MKWFNLKCFLIILTFFCKQFCVADPFISGPLIIRSALQLYNVMKIAKNAMMDQKESGVISPSTAQVITRLDSLSTDFQDMKNMIIDKITTLPDYVTLKTDELFRYVKSIQHDYERFLKIYKNEGNLQESVILDFATTITKERSDLIKTVEQMYDIFDPNFKQQSVITLLLDHSSAQDTMCIRGQSSQLMILDLLNLVIVTHTKALLMILSCFDLRESIENKSYQNEKDDATKGFSEAVSKLRDSTVSYVTAASREVWRCDPKKSKHVKDWTYLKFDGVLQKFFLYQTDVSTHAELSSFVLSCEKYKDERLYCHSFPCQSQPEEKRCLGHLRDCEFLARWMQICHAPLESDRRYEWMKLKTNETYGHENGECPYYTQGLQSSITVDTCICTCESENRKMNRYVSLREETTDVYTNKVVTGVRFVMKGHVLFLQIQEATLGIEASIIDEPEWKPVKEFDNLYDEEISTEHREGSDRWTEFYKNGMVYTITYKNHTLLLDDLKVDPGHVVTGVRFANYYNSLLLLVQQTPFQYSSGSMYHDEKKWIMNRKTKKERQQVVLTEPNEPIRAGKPETYFHGEGWVDFQMTNFKKDLGQNIIPYFDAQEVSINPPLPLQGIGLFHKGKKYSGGYISPKIIHYDLSKEENVEYNKEKVEANNENEETDNEVETEDESSY